MSFAFRSATADDAERLAELSLLAYPTTDVDLAERVRRYRAGRPSPIETVTVVERAGVLVGSYRNIPYTGWLGGVPAAVGGLASVAVAPEARLQGVAGAMIRRHVADLRAARTPWSFLYPFAPRFYAHYGWAAAARRLRWRVQPEAIPLLPERARVRRLQGEAAAMHALHERMLPRTHGALARTLVQLERAAAETHAVCVGVDGAAAGSLSGYLVYHLVAPTQRPQTLKVADWVAEDVASERALLGFLGAQRDQVSEIVVDTAEDHPLGALLDNAAPAVEDDHLPSEHHALATLASGLMARIVSLPDAIAARGYPGVARGAVGLRVTADPIFADNVTQVTARIEDGRALATAAGSGGHPVITGPIGPMSAILVGALRVDGAARLGLVEVEGDVAAATALLSLPPLAPGIAF